MIMMPRLSKFALTVHLVSSVGVLGAIAGFLALALAGLSSDNRSLVRSAYVAMDLIAWVVIAPMTFAALLTGVIQSLGTAWGLFRHYWILFKLLITIFVVVVLLAQMESVSLLAAVAERADLLAGNYHRQRFSLIVHSGGGLLVLLAPVALSTYKPKGLTPYGARKLRDRPLKGRPWPHDRGSPGRDEASMRD